MRYKLTVAYPYYRARERERHDIGAGAYRLYVIMLARRSRDDTCDLKDAVALFPKRSERQMRRYKSELRDAGLIIPVV